MSQLQLIDAACQIEQAQAVLSMWLESTTTVTEADGTSSQVAIYSNGNAGMVVYPFAERLAMANNIEGAMIERYGVEQGTANAIVFYQAMIDTERGELTTFGRETLAELHNSFIAELDENGWPEMPLAH